LLLVAAVADQDTVVAVAVVVLEAFLMFRYHLDLIIL
jgi:hypothetical protein